MYLGMGVLISLFWRRRSGKMKSDKMYNIFESYFAGNPPSETCEVRTSIWIARVGCLKSRIFYEK
jgi:hypothetical protein